MPISEPKAEILARGAEKWGTRTRGPEIGSDWVGSVQRVRYAMMWAFDAAALVALEDRLYDMGFTPNKAPEEQGGAFTWSDCAEAMAGHPNRFCAAILAAEEAGLE